MNAVIAAGGVPLVLPLIDDETDINALAQLCDGFLFTGGPDVHPALYKEDAMRYCGSIDDRRDTLELHLFHEVSRLDKPIFGICRGIQLINAALGGSLYQDIPAQVQGEPIVHDQHRPYHVPVHSVMVDRGSQLYHIVGQEELMVNSMHHQAIKAIAPSLACAAMTKDDLIECVEVPGKRFLMAVQWHPEWMPLQSASQKLFTAFIDAAKKE